MQIIKYKKSKGNTYLVQIDNHEYLLYDDVIVKNNLLLKKEISKEELKLLLKTNQDLSSYYKSLEYLNKKMRTTKEIRIFLEKEGFREDIINKCLEKLKKQNYLDDQKYISSYIDSNLVLTLKGPLKLKEELEKMGLDNQDIESYLKTIKEEIWQVRCNDLAKKKIKTNHKDSQKIFKQKLTFYLKNYGYPEKYIKNSLKEIKLPDDKEFLKHEYEKQKRKLEKKYSGQTLEYQIKLKLMAKGFNPDELDI